MDDFLVHAVTTGLTVRVDRPMPSLSPELDARVEQLWRDACAEAEQGKAGRLFNGQIFSVDRLHPQHITGHLTEFRRVVAQMREPALFQELHLRPLAVCGALRCADGLVIGRRHADAVYQPARWQLPPAGSVDAAAVRPDGSVDFAAALLAELAEELGLPASTVDRPHPLCIVEHPGSHVCDFGLGLRTHLRAAEILAAHRRSGNAEYDPLRVVPDAELADFLIHVRENLVPPALAFIQRLGLPAD